MSNKAKSQDSLVKVIPVETEKEYRDKFGKKTQMNRHWQSEKSGRFFAANLKAEQLKPGLIKARVKLENLLLNDEGDFISYMYKSRPMIKLNVKEGQFYTPASAIEEFGKEAVQHQAHIILDILKNNGLSNAQRGKEMLQSNARQTLSNLKSYNKQN